MKNAARVFAGLRSKARIGILVEGVAVLAVAFVGFVVVSYALDRTFRLEVGYRAFLLATLVAGAARLAWLRIGRPLRVELTDEEFALAVERADPELHESLISAMQFDQELARDRVRGESPALMQRVVAHVETEFARIPFARALDGKRVARYLAIAALAVGAFGTWTAIRGDEVRLWALRNLALSGVEWPRDTQLRFLDVEPGVAIRIAERDDLTVRVEAAGVIPDRVVLDIAFDGGERAERRMEQLGDGTFGATLESLLDGATLRAYGGDGETDAVRVELVPRPRLSGLEIRVANPDYTGLGETVIEDSGGELRIPRGSRLRLTASSTKALTEAALTFDEERVAVARLDANGTQLDAEFAPPGDGTLSFAVVDTDRLGLAQPPRLYVRVVDDVAPQLEFATEGIGTLISPIARIPGTLTARDDYGLRTLTAAYRVTDARRLEDDRPPDGDPTAGDPPPAPEFRPAPVAGLDVFAAGEREFDGPVLLDLRQLNPNEDDLDAPENLVRAGHVLALRFDASDNRTPDAGTGSSETLNFRIVSIEKLLEELRRRQGEQRRELERVLEREVEARRELGDILLPADNDPESQQARLRILALGRQQGALGHRVQGVADRYQQVLSEFLNNRLFEPNVTTRSETRVVAPLRQLAAESFPASAAATAALAEGGDGSVREELIEGYDRIIATIETVLANMERTESLAALVETLKVIRKMEGRASSLVEDLLDEQTDDLFDDPDKGKKDK